MRAKPKSKKGITVTPQQRADQFPDDFIVKNNALFCKWCSRYIGHNRKDNVMLHLYSKLHRDMSKKTMAKKTAPKIKITVKKPKQIKSGTEFASSSQDETSQDESLPEEDLKNLFDDSDSSSFEGFGEGNEEKATQDGDEYRKSGRSRKKPARLSEIEDENVKKRKADSQPETSEIEVKKQKIETFNDIPIRSMPIKKQISYNIRKTSTDTAAESTGSLKMKISRNRGTKSSDDNSFDESSKDNIKVVSTKVETGALKMKFVLKNKNVDPETKTTIKTLTRKNKSTVENISSGSSKKVVQSPTSRVATRKKSKEGEKITELKKQPVVKKSEARKSEIQIESKTEKASSRTAMGSPKLEKVTLSPKIVKPAPKQEKLTPKSDKVTKANKSTSKVDKSTPKIVKPLPKIKPSPKVAVKSTPKIIQPANDPSTKIPMVKKQKGVTKNSKTTSQDKKKKITGYMLWSKNMRSQIATQYPGLEFGDVSKKLGDLWKKLSLKEKQMWHVRSIKLNNGGGKMTSNGLDAKPIRKPGGRMIETGPKKKIASVNTDVLNYQPVSRHPDIDMEKDLQRLSKPSSDVVDVAAHFSLLGESFMDLHSKVSQSNAEITMRDAQGTLMDGLLSCLVPLIALTKQIPCLKDSIDEEDFQESLANIAHIVPGL